MCAQEVNIEEQCAEHFLLQNDRSAEQIQNIFGLRVNLLQNKFKICVMGTTAYIGLKYLNLKLPISDPIILRLEHYRLKCGGQIDPSSCSYCIFLWQESIGLVKQEFFLL